MSDPIPEQPRGDGTDQPLVRAYRWTASRKIRIVIARQLYYLLLDGLGHDNEKLKDALWDRIDRELDAAKLTRHDL